MLPKTTPQITITRHIVFMIEVVNVILPKCAFLVMRIVLVSIYILMVGDTLTVCMPLYQQCTINWIRNLCNHLLFYIFFIITSNTKKTYTHKHHTTYTLHTW